MSICAQAAGTYADDLDAAQEDARRAIHDARDAQRRIDAAEADLEAALGAREQRHPTRSTAADTQHRDVVRDRCAGHERGGRPRQRRARRSRTPRPPRPAPGAGWTSRPKPTWRTPRSRGNEAEQDARDRRCAPRRARSRASPATHRPPPLRRLPDGGRGPRYSRASAPATTRCSEEVPYNYLPEDTQRAIAAEIAEESPTLASYGEGARTRSRTWRASSGKFHHDDEFATGFYNELGRAPAPTTWPRDIVIFFNGEGRGARRTRRSWR